MLFRSGHKKTHSELVIKGTQGVYKSCYEDSSSKTDGNDGFQRRIMYLPTERVVSGTLIPCTHFARFDPPKICPVK